MTPSRNSSAPSCCRPSGRPYGSADGDVGIAAASTTSLSAIVRIDMRVVVQRVSRASVQVEDRVAGEIGAGLLVLVGVAERDGDAEADRLAGKVARLRIFENDDGRFDRSLLDTGGAVLAVSQFTLIADTEN